MEEARRVMRYVLPGLATLLLFVLACLVTIPNETGDKLAKLGGSDGFAAAVVTILAAGGLGYLWASLYHAVGWACRRFSYLRLDNHSAFEFLIEKEKLTAALVYGNTKPAIPSDVRADPRIAWALMNAMWWMRNSEKKVLYRATERGNPLVDVLHGIGALVVGASLTMVGWLYSHWKCKGSFGEPVLLVFTLWALLIVFLCLQFRTVRVQCSVFFAHCLSVALTEAESREAEDKAVDVDPAAKCGKHCECRCRSHETVDVELIRRVAGLPEAGA